MDKIVLDSWAVIAWLNKEPGYKQIDQWLEKGRREEAVLLMSIINIGEVYLQIGRKRGKEMARTIIEKLRQIPIQVVRVSNALVYKAFDYQFSHDLPLADAFVLATADREDAQILTGDSHFKPFDRIIWVSEEN
ncbi:MAG: type II toxin-antitoxin system VapC family toxin [Candidatus Bipolaricaulia bacterium]